MVLMEVGVEMAQVGRDPQVAGRDDCTSGGVLERIDVELEIVFEEASERFEDAALQVGVIFLVENFAQARHAHRDADFFLGLPEQVGGKR